LFLNAEMKFDAGFFGGFSLTTTNFSDTNFQTFTGGFQNYGIYINKAFLGWNGYPGLTVVAGKQDLPFYANTLFWDAAKMFPQGLVERIDFDQLLGWNSGGEPVSYSKEGKAPPPAPAKHHGTDSLGNVIGYRNLAQPSDKDKTAWLLGLKIADNKKAGDLSAYVDYRQIGIAAVDPNLSFDDAMIGRLNFRGFGFGIDYNVTDFLILGLSGRVDWNLTNLYGGQATRGSGIADDTSWDYIRVEALLKF
jgi:hypothetical protein